MIVASTIVPVATFSPLAARCRRTSGQPVRPGEEALYDSLAMRRFVGIDLGREPVSDETTVCRFRHLLEEHELGQQLFDGRRLEIRSGR